VITLRRALARTVVALLLVTGLVLCGLVWALQSDAGSRQLLLWAMRAGAGADHELAAGRIEGSLLDGLRLGDVRYTAVDGSVELTLRRVEFAFEPWQLLQRRFSLAMISAEGLRWRSRRDPVAPAAAFDARVIAGWFAGLPLRLNLGQVALRDLEFQVDNTLVHMPELFFAAALDREQITLSALRLDVQDTRVTGTLTLQQDLTVMGALEWARGADTAWEGELQVAGTLSELQVQHQLRLPLTVQSAGRIVTGLVAGEVLQLDLRHRLAAADFADWGEPALAVSDVELRTMGTPARLMAELALQAQYQDHAAVSLAASAEYTPDSIRLVTADVSGEELSLQLDGAWDVSGRTLDLHWNLARLDMERHGLRLAAVQGGGSVALNVADTGLLGRVKVGPLQGRLNDHALMLEGELQLQDSAVQALTLDLRSADNQLRLDGTVQPALDLAWILEAPALIQLHEALSGQVSGAGRISGSSGAPLLTGTMQGRALAVEVGAGRIGVQEIHLEAAASGEANALSLELTSLAWQRDGITTTLLDTLGARLDGSLAEHELSLQLSGMDSTLDIVLSGVLQDQLWQGRVVQAALASRFGNWSPDAPFAVAWREAALQVEQHCWLGSLPELCLSVNGSGTAGYDVAFEVRDLPLVWANRGVTALGKPAALQELQSAWGLDLPPGLALQGSATLVGSIDGMRAWPPVAGRAELLTQDIQLQLTSGNAADDTAEVDIPRYLVAAEPLRLVLADGIWRAATDLSITQIPDAQLTGSEAVFQGTLGGDVTVDRDSKLGGVLRLAFDDLAFLETLVSGLQQPAGRLQGEASLAGSLSMPEVDADLVVTQGAFTLPALGISVQDFGATLHSTNDALSLRASGVSGQGELVLQARLLRPFASDREFSAHLEGSGFTLLNTAAAAATISPALDVGFAGGMLELQGVVGLDQAMLDLEGLARDVTDGGVSVSRDAVVLQPDSAALVAAPQRALPFNASLDLSLGSAVRVHGFGLDVALNGELRLQQDAGRPLLAYGELGIPEGTYRIYNQQLKVRDGRLLFYGNPVNPVLDVRAFRETPGAEVGVLLSGTLGRIESRPYSTPTLPDNEILAMLVTGKSFNNMNAEDGSALLSAVANFGIQRGEGLTSMIDNKLGLDTVAISGGATYLESSLGLGKYLTPELLMRYEIGIFDRQAVLSIDYTLSERIRLEVRSGLSQSVDISYTIEKD
jgi:translocation and assembly module TamB